MSKVCSSALKVSLESSLFVYQWNIVQQDMLKYCFSSKKYFIYICYLFLVAMHHFFSFEWTRSFSFVQLLHFLQTTASTPHPHPQKLLSTPILPLRPPPQNNHHHKHNFHHQHGHQHQHHHSPTVPSLDSEVDIIGKAVKVMRTKFLSLASTHRKWPAPPQRRTERGRESTKGQWGVWVVVGGGG